MVSTSNILGERDGLVLAQTVPISLTALTRTSPTSVLPIFNWEKLIQQNRSYKVAPSAG